MSLLKKAKPFSNFVGWLQQTFLSVFIPQTSQRYFACKQEPRALSISVPLKIKSAQRNKLAFVNRKIMRAKKIEDIIAVIVPSQLTPPESPFSSGFPVRISRGVFLESVPISEEKESTNAALSVTSEDAKNPPKPVAA